MWSDAHGSHPHTHLSVPNLIPTPTHTHSPTHTHTHSPARTHTHMPYRPGWTHTVGPRATCWSGTRRSCRRAPFTATALCERCTSSAPSSTRSTCLTLSALAPYSAFGARAVSSRYATPSVDALESAVCCMYCIPVLAQHIRPLKIHNRSTTMMAVREGKCLAR